MCFENMFSIRIGLLCFFIAWVLFLF